MMCKVINIKKDVGYVGKSFIEDGVEEKRIIMFDFCKEELYDRIVEFSEDSSITELGIINNNGRMVLIKENSSFLEIARMHNEEGEK